MKELILLLSMLSSPIEAQPIAQQMQVDSAVVHHIRQGSRINVLYDEQILQLISNVSPSMTPDVLATPLDKFIEAILGMELYHQAYTSGQKVEGRVYANPFIGRPFFDVPEDERKRDVVVFEVYNADSTQYIQYRFISDHMTLYEQFPSESLDEIIFKLQCRDGLRTASWKRGDGMGHSSIIPADKEQAFEHWSKELYNSLFEMYIK